MKCLNNLESFALLKSNIGYKEQMLVRLSSLRVRIRSVKGCWGQLEYTESTDAFLRYHPGPECMYNAPLSVLHCAAFPPLYVIHEDAAATKLNTPFVFGSETKRTQWKRKSFRETKGNS